MNEIKSLIDDDIKENIDHSAICVKFAMMSKQLEEKDKEIERLNNIINKIIEFLQREQIEKGEYCDFLIENKQIKVQEVLDKIKELKGSDKE